MLSDIMTSSVLSCGGAFISDYQSLSLLPVRCSVDKWRRRPRRCCGL